MAINIKDHLRDLSASITSVFGQERWYAAYSALALVIIQVGIGFVLKAAQTNGEYGFSPSASVTISELIKMLLAGGMFYREWKEREPTSSTAEYHQIETHQIETQPRESDVDEESLEGGTAVSSQVDDQEMVEIEDKTTPRSYWQAVRTEVSIDVIFGLCVLALFYVLINNLVSRGRFFSLVHDANRNKIFVSYRLADPATVQLTKSGVTCITALVLIVVMRVKVSRVQWLAIVMQVSLHFITMLGLLLTSLL